MRIAPTKSGKWVTLDVATPVFQNGKLVGFNAYVYSNETYPVPTGGVAYYAIRVFIPN